MNKFEKTTIKAYRKPVGSWQPNFVDVAGYKFGDTGLGYYKAEGEGYYVIHLASGMSLCTFSRQAQAKAVVTEAAAIEFDWTIAEDKLIANAVLADGTKLRNKFREVCAKYE